MSTGLERGLLLLENLARKKQPMSFSEINTGLGSISHASLSRLLQRLCELGYVSRDTGSGLYTCGHRLAVFAGIRTAGRAEYLLERHSALMEELSKGFNVTVILLEKVKDRLINIRKVHTDASITMQEPGTVNQNADEIWLETLAAFDDDVRQQHYASGARAEFDRIARRGWGYDDQHRRPNIRRLAFPLRDGSGEVIGLLGLGGSILELTDATVAAIVTRVVAATAV